MKNSTQDDHTCEDQFNDKILFLQGLETNVWDLKRTYVSPPRLSYNRQSQYVPTYKPPQLARQRTNTKPDENKASQKYLNTKPIKLIGLDNSKLMAHLRKTVRMNNISPPKEMALIIESKQSFASPFNRKSSVPQCFQGYAGNAVLQKQTSFTQRLNVKGITPRQDYQLQTLNESKKEIIIKPDKYANYLEEFKLIRTDTKTNVLPRIVTHQKPREIIFRKLIKESKHNDILNTSLHGWSDTSL